MGFEYSIMLYWVITQKDHNKEVHPTKGQRTECSDFSDTVTNISFVASIKIFILDKVRATLNLPPTNYTL